MTALAESPKPKRPPRPPPPRSQLIPARAIDAVLNDDRLDIPGVVATPTDGEGGEECGRGQETGPTASVSLQQKIVDYNHCVCVLCVLCKSIFES